MNKEPAWAEFIFQIGADKFYGGLQGFTPESSLLMIPWRNDHQYQYWKNQKYTKHLIGQLEND